MHNLLQTLTKIQGPFTAFVFLALKFESEQENFFKFNYLQNQQDYRATAPT
jgi:hypothetical protein